MKKLIFSLYFFTSLFIGHSQIIKTVAGTGVLGNSGDGNLATLANINKIGNITLDNLRNLYITDHVSHVIRKVNFLNGIITTVAGTGVAGYSGNGGPATLAQIHFPQDIDVDTLNNFYFADYWNSSIRKINIGTGIISNVAGVGGGGFTGDGGPATSAALWGACGVALDSLGNIYIADSYNNRIRKVTKSTGIINTIAGTGVSGFSGDGGPALSAQLNLPGDIDVDSYGNVYFSDSDNHCVRKIDAVTGIISKIAGTSSPGFSGDGGLAINAMLNTPCDVFVNKNGSILYIADYLNYRVRMVNTVTGIISTICGTGVMGYSGDGGLATAAKINSPTGVVEDACGNIYISDENGTVREIINGINAPSLATQPSSISVCVGSSINFNTSVTGPNLNYQWYHNNSIIAGSTTANFIKPNTSLADSGNYYCLVFNNCNLISTDTVRAVIKPYPTLMLTQNYSVICVGIQDSLFASGTAGASYLWSPSTNLNSSTGGTVIASYSVAGNYSIEVTSTLNGCSTKDTLNLIVINTPSVLAGTTQSICPGQSVTINASNATSWIWSPTSGLSCSNCQNPIASPSITTNYTVLISNPGCLSSSIVQTVAVWPKVTSAFTFSLGSTTIPQTIIFFNNSIGATSYYWDFGDNSNSILQSPSHVFQLPGSYNVLMIAYDSNGCNDTISSIFIIKDDSCGISMPNIFTPNYDDVNDVIKPKVRCIQSLTCYIFDRWGLLVGQIDQINGFWDGHTTSGEACSDGVYFYTLKATDLNNKDYKLNGFIHLIH